MEPVRCRPLDDFPVEPENGFIVLGVSRTNMKLTYFEEGRRSAALWYIPNGRRNRK